MKQKRVLWFWLAFFAFALFGCDMEGIEEKGTPDSMTYTVVSDAELSDTLTMIGARSAPDGGEYTITVTVDFTSGGYIIAGKEYNGKHIILKGTGAGERTIQYEKSVRFLFEIANGKLTLENITLKGDSVLGTATTYNDKALCRVTYDGVLLIRDGTKITGNINNTGGDPDGEAYRGGGGVEVRNGGKLEMYGGEITGNYANRGGGVGVFGRVVPSAFVMEGGRIHNNNVDIEGTGSNYIKAGWGGGVHINFWDDSFTMSGGTIDFNKAARNGGGVSLCCGTFTLTGNAVISDNEAGTSGGGVAMCCCYVYMKGGVIKKNKAGTSTSTNTGSTLVFRYGGGIGRTASANAQKPFPGVWEAPNEFHKTGGVIYGSDGGENANTVINAYTDPMHYDGTDTAKGDAVYLLREYSDTTISGNYDFADKVEYNPKGY